MVVATVFGLTKTMSKGSTNMSIIAEYICGFIVEKIRLGPISHRTEQGKLEYINDELCENKWARPAFVQIFSSQAL